MWQPGIPGGYHDDPRGNRASGHANPPVAVVAVNTRRLNLQPRHEPMVRRILLQVLHELVPCHPAAELARNPVARKVRQRADRMQVQTVVTTAPRLPRTPALKDGGVYPAPTQCRRSGQSSGSSADDDDIVHPHRLLLI